jgi:hypothetical protein
MWGETPPLNNRQRMRASNKLVREWLLKNNYDEIWFKPHGKRNDYVFTQKGNYMAQDIWNLFDGICITPSGWVVFLQMKTNSWASEKDFIKFRKKCPQMIILSFNVTNKLKECKGKYKVFVREY